MCSLRSPNFIYLLDLIIDLLKAMISKQTKLNWNYSITGFISAIFMNVWLRAKWALDFAQVKSLVGCWCIAVFCGVMLKMPACLPASRIKDAAGRKQQSRGGHADWSNLSPHSPPAHSSGWEIWSEEAVLSSSEKDKYNLVILALYVAN